MKTMRSIGNYEIISHLGSDPFFDSYLASDTIRKRKVVLKVFKQGRQEDQKTIRGFFEKAQLATDLVHPHLAWTWETGEINGKYYLVERYIEGASLQQLLDTSGKIPDQQAQEIISQVARGLEFAHSRGFAHGNLQPGKIIVNPELGAVLTDFGAALVMQASTTSWTSVVTPQMEPYLAPELRQVKLPGPQSDQFSLACIWAEILSGEKPFEKSSQQDTTMTHTSPFAVPLSWAATIPWPTAKAILRGLEHDPSKRFIKIYDLPLAPGKIQAEIKQDPLLREEAENQAHAWQEAKQRARLEAEETARLAALEEARREIKEELLSQDITPTVAEASASENLSQAEEKITEETERTEPRKKPMLVKKFAFTWFFITLAASILVAALAPLEKTLGANARLVYFHGAWVWTAMLAFFVAAITGALGLLTRRINLHAWSLALGRTGLFFWLIFLPMSLWVMQANWNGLFLDEPRFRIPLNFAVVGLLLQVGLSFLSMPALSSIGNILYGILFFWGMTRVETVLHPDSPIFSSGARDIQIYFLGLFILLSVCALFLTFGWLNLLSKKYKPG